MWHLFRCLYGNWEGKIQSKGMRWFFLFRMLTSLPHGLATRDKLESADMREREAKVIFSQSQLRFSRSNISNP